MSPRLPRRTWLASALAATALAALPRSAWALGRTPEGGSLRLHVPWSTASMDPHDLADPLAALFGSAVFDSLFALDSGGNPYPTLAQALPAVEGGVVVLRLREGLRSGRGKALDARDVVASLRRAATRGARAWLADVPTPKVHTQEPLTVVFGRVEPNYLAKRLASPLTAIVPRASSPLDPDATGPFMASVEPSRLRLSRNLRAARGASFLDAIEVERGSDLRTSLRAFEAGHDDVGWLGAGLFEPRKGAQRFDFGRVALVVLSATQGAFAFANPGVLQPILDALPQARLAHLGLGALPQGRGTLWPGPAVELGVDEASPHLVEIADTLAPLLSSSGHEVTRVALRRDDLAQRRASGRIALSLDVVRLLGPEPADVWLSLASADDPARASEMPRKIPKLSAQPAFAELTKSLRLGVLGELRVSGATMPEVVLRAGAEGWDLGASFKKRIPTKR